jgi:hypothetical protein
MQILHIFSFLLFVGIAKTNDSKATRYEKLIYEAETLITEEKYQEAVNTYDKAFQINNYMFAIDIENALIANIQIKDWKKAAFWTEKLMLKGVEKNFFDSRRFIEFRKTPEWNNLIVQYNTIRSEFKKGYNQVLVDSLLVLLELDETASAQSEFRETMDDRTEVTNNNINERLVKLIETHGYPSEEQIGVNIYDHFNLSGNVALNYDVLFRHSSSATTSNPDALTLIIQKAIDDVLVRKDVFEDDIGGYQLTFVLVGDNIYENPNFEGPENKEKINLLRKKIVFKNTKNKAGFNFHTPLAIFGGAELEGEEWFMSEHIFLVKHQP